VLTLAAPHALAFLQAIPSCSELIIPSRHIPIILANMLGAPPPLPSSPFSCLCGERLDSFCSHLTLCHRRAPQRRHDAQVDLLMALGRAAGFHTSAASSLLHLHADSNKVPDAKIGNVIIDFQQLNSLAPSSFTAAGQPKSIITYGENEIITKHDAAVASVRCRFIPFVIDRLGAFGPRALQYFNFLSHQISPFSFVSPNGTAPPPSTFWFLQSFSLSLRNNNASEFRFLHSRRLQNEQR